VANRVGGIDLDVDDGARSEMLIAGQTCLEVLHGNPEPLDGEIGGGAKGDERAALSDELAERLNTLIANAATILGADILAGRAINDCLGRLVGENDRVVAITESACTNVGVVERRRRKPVLLEHPAGPSFIHVSTAPGLKPP